MKKILYSFFALMLAVCSLASCDDVPAPYQIPGIGGDEGGDNPAVTGDGSVDNPFNCAGIIAFTESLGSDVESAEMVYMKGKVYSITENFDGDFGNATFYIADDENGTNKFYAYRVNYLDNKKYTSGDVLKVGDEVVICAKVVNYKGNTPETVQNAGYVYSLNGKTSAGTGGGSEVTGEAKGDGTLENPYNSVAANKKASELASGEKSDVVYIKGIVVSVKEQYGTQYGNASFYISDDGKSANQFYVFRALYLNNEKYTSGELLAPGDEVVICGKLTNYMGNTPETATGEAYLYSLKSNGGSTGGDDNPGGGTGGDVSGNSITVTASAFGLENAYDLTTSGLTLTDGTTVTFEAGGNTNGPKYYTSGTAIRMYTKNTMKISSSKTIKSVVLNCVEASGTKCVADGKIDATPGSVAVDNLTVNVTSINSKETTITNSNPNTGTVNQLRWSSMVITYAE